MSAVIEITDHDYFSAMARIARNEHTDDDLNLARAWEARVEEQRNRTIADIRRAVEKLETELDGA